MFESQMDLCRQRQKSHLRTTGRWRWENNYGTFLPVWSPQPDFPSLQLQVQHQTKRHTRPGMKYRAGMETPDISSTQWTEAGPDVYES